MHTERNVNFNGPYASSLMILGIRTVFLIFCQSCAVYFFDLFKRCKVDSFRIVYPAVGVAYCNNFSAELLSLLCRVDRNVS